MYFTLIEYNLCDFIKISIVFIMCGGEVKIPITHESNASWVIFATPDIMNSKLCHCLAR